MSSRGSREIEDLLRELAPQVLGALVRRYGQFDACEDALQEALLAAARQWPTDGLPDRPRGWLIAVATRRLIDEIRADRSRRAREELEAAVPGGLAGSDGLTAAGEPVGAGGAVGADTPTHDDSLALLFHCCQPALTPASQIALTLRAVGGLSTAEIASALLVPEATMAQRISRAKQTLRTGGLVLDLPEQAERSERLRAVRHLIFNEGYTATAGPLLQQVELTDEAVRLTRMLHRLLPDDGETAGLLALMVLTDARRRARIDEDGGLVPLADQDRSRWNQEALREGVALVEGALAAGVVGPYQLQAAIAALHAEAPSAAETDWAQILGLYTLLLRIAPNPVFSLNRAVAVAMAMGPDAGLAELAAVEHELAGPHRLEAVRAHMLERAGQRTAAVAAYQRAATQTRSLPERRYLESRAAALGSSA
jgi:RNA polymerase sigma factor (sigma-70 family)